MARERSIFAGMTDYTGVDLADITAHFGEWQRGLRASADVLGNIRTRLEAAGPDSRVADGLETIDYFRDLFERYAADLERLKRELSRAVLARHVETVRQLYQSAVHEENHCVAFKRHYRLDALSPRDEVQNILAEVYRLSRDELINLKDLSNVVPRLKALETGQAEPQLSSESAMNALELKPNVFGIGINFNWIWERLRRRR